MSVITDVIQKATALSMAEKIQAAQKATSELLAGLKACDIDDDTAINILVSTFKLFVSADRNMDDSEYVLFKEMLGIDLDKDSFYNMTNYGSAADFVKAMDELVDAAPDDVAINIVLLGALIITVDGEVTQEEAALLQRIYQR